MLPHEFPSAPLRSSLCGGPHSPRSPATTLLAPVTTPRRPARSGRPPAGCDQTSRRRGHCLRPVRQLRRQAAAGARTGVMTGGGVGAVEEGGTIFVYGTLMAPEIVELLIKRMPSHSPATLAGHRRVRVKGADFPAVVRELSAGGERTGQVEGLLLRGLDDVELTIFDDYEDDDYTRDIVTVTLPDGSQADAFVYIWGDHVRHKLTSEPWDYAAFRANDMEGYMARMMGFVTEMAGVWAELRRQQA
mmetsp:Transcript_26421/g.67920  ORF Transcript_26421/g.67920 Transcript_26421/m.67920 type:complete len:246 (-) Transcript_26421:351-1088(-)